MWLRTHQLWVSSNLLQLGLLHWLTCEAPLPMIAQHLLLLFVNSGRGGCCHSRLLVCISAAGRRSGTQRGALFLFVEVAYMISTFIPWTRAWMPHPWSPGKANLVLVIDIYSCATGMFQLRERRIFIIVLVPRDSPWDRAQPVEYWICDGRTVELWCRPHNSLSVPHQGF